MDYNGSVETRRTCKKEKVKWINMKNVMGDQGEKETDLGEQGALGGQVTKSDVREEEQERVERGGKATTN